MKRHCGLVVGMSASDANGPGSIPGMGISGVDIGPIRQSFRLKKKYSLAGFM